MSAKSPENSLVELLTKGDPLVDDPGLSPAQISEMRYAVLEQTPENKPQFWPQWSPALSVATLLALALGAAWWPSARNETQPAFSQSDQSPVTLNSSSTQPETTGSGSNVLEDRKIQFETPGGTLVVWVLNPNFPS